MKITPTQLIHALELTRKRLVQRKGSYICFTLVDLADDGLISVPVSIYLRHWVDKMLCPYGSYGQWLEQRDYDLPAWILMRIKHQGIREGRIAWLDWMISELKKELKKDE